MAFDPVSVMLRLASQCGYKGKREGKRVLIDFKTVGLKEYKYKSSSRDRGGGEAPVT